MVSSMFAPTDPHERLPSLDALRGLALFGVLMVNLQTDFRVSLFTYYARFNANRGWANIATDYAIRFFLESKAVVIFSFLFGVGMALLFERARRHGREHPVRVVLRRLLVLAGFGAVHLLFWNGDILLAYALAGTLVCPALLASTRVVVVLAVACGTASVVNLPLPGLPDAAVMLKQGAAATAAYGGGGVAEMGRFRWNETHLYIAPLVLGSLPRIMGLFLAGIAAGRLELFTGKGRHRRQFGTAAAVGLAIGGATSALRLLELGGQLHLGPASNAVFFLSSVPFALGWVALFFWASSHERWLRRLRIFAPAGRMALTNYLTQSIVLSFVFYGYGLGLVGRLPTGPVALGGVAFYALQVLISRYWLLRFRFGPFEWFWRSLTFSRLGPRDSSADH